MDTNVRSLKWMFLIPHKGPITLNFSRTTLQCSGTSSRIIGLLITFPFSLSLSLSPPLSLPLSLPSKISCLEQD